VYRPRVDRPTTSAAPGVSPSAGRPLPPAAGGAPPPIHELDRVDPTFVADLQASEAARAAVARWFRRRGQPTVMPALRVRPTPAERAAYRDRGDLLVRGRRVEVRGRTNLVFTGPGDYPWADVLVTDCAKFDGARGRVPAVYVIASGDLRAALWIPVRATRAAWRVKPGRGNGRTVPCYFCPTALTTAVRLPPP